MPIPFILGAFAVAAGVAGVGAGIKGAVDMADANDTLNQAKKRDEKNQQHYKNVDTKACNAMDRLGALEINVLASFKTFSEVIEKVKNRPTFADINKENINIPKFDAKDLEQASVGAGILVGGLSGAALGTLGGYAAAGATTAAVVALGTASTGTPIAALSGAAATNATLAALGGGSLATGGGGMVLGSAVLSGATLGVGLLVGGIIFGMVGSNISEKADKAYSQMLENEKVINKICSYLESLCVEANKYYTDLNKANEVYMDQFRIMQYIVEARKDADGLVDWRQLNQYERTIINNVIMLVGLLYHMCKVKLVKVSADEDKINTVNKVEIDEARKKCKDVLEIIGPY